MLRPAAILCCAAIAILGLFLLLVRLRRNAGDTNARIKAAAVEVRKVIVALDRYKLEHGHFPADLASAGIHSVGWFYSTTKPAGYTLAKKLGVDPTLQYRFENGVGRWVYDPGDGSPERDLTL